MDQDQLKDKWMDYLNGALSKEEWEAIKTEHPRAHELDDLEKLWVAMDDAAPVPEPGRQMDDRFYATLGEFMKSSGPKERASLRDLLTELLSWRRLALAMIIFVIGGAVGYVLSPSGEYRREISSLSSEMKDMKEMMMLTLLEKPAAQDRLRAVSLSTELSEADSRIIQALVQTLNTDENVNVRLVTVEALARFGNYPEVREALVNSIGLQTSPLVQIALADAMVALNEKRAVEQLRGLLDKKDLNEAVRERVQQSIEVLT